MRRVTGSILVLALAASAPGAAHDAPRAINPVSVATAQYAVPAVALVRADGRAVTLRDELDDGRPVVMNFIFTSCGAICPLMTQTFAQFQRRLGNGSAGVHLVSISIDPEQDTPERLREYAAKFHAGPGWSYYTGTLQASIAAQQAFGVYRGDKMAHGPVTLMRAAPGEPWRRIDGFASPDELLRQFRSLTEPR